ncbi:MAG: hypothetical protein ACTHQ3_10560 [Motilibacteraceae bacterium]
MEGAEEAVAAGLPPAATGLEGSAGRAGDEPLQAVAVSRTPAARPPVRARMPLTRRWR